MSGTEAIHLAARVPLAPEVTLDTTKLLAKAKRLAADDTVFDELDPFFWAVRISTNVVDFYRTRMHASTLRRFARNLGDGVSYQNSHDTSELGFGQSLTGRYIEHDDQPADKEGILPASTIGEFFSLRGLNLNGVSTDDLLNAMRSGVVRDVSVGFFAEDIRCSICEEQMFFGWFGGLYGRCDHVPGMTYEVDNAKREAYAWVHDGELVEVSQVYDGATPGASVLKAELMARSGKLDDRARRTLELRYHRALPTPDRSWSGSRVEGSDAVGTTKRDKIETPDKEVIEVTSAAVEEPVPNVAEETTIEEPAAGSATTTSEPAVSTDDPLAGERARLAPQGIHLGRSATAAVRTLGDEVIRLRAETQRLAPLADLGGQYRADLIDGAVKEGVRARASRFKAEEWRTRMESMDTDTIRALRDEWKDDGDRALSGTGSKPGGRSTVEDSELDLAGAGAASNGREKPAGAFKDN